MSHKIVAYTGLTKSVLYAKSHTRGTNLKHWKPIKLKSTNKKLKSKWDIFYISDPWIFENFFDKVMNDDDKSMHRVKVPVHFLQVRKCL